LPNYQDGDDAEQGDTAEPEEAASGEA
jgi:hypothetical protein